MADINYLKRQIVQAAYNAKSGHIPSAFSILDIVQTLYSDVMLKDDRFVLSKGHGCLALYAVLADKGYITWEQFMSFSQRGSILGGHPDRNKVPGVLCSTGSLGHGLPMAVGRALAKKIKKEPGRVFCLVGDGELNEGSCWEALMIADQQSLDNLTVIIDRNRTGPVTLINLDGRFNSFGFSTAVISGHDTKQIKSNCIYNKGSLAIIAKTVKGKGCVRMQALSWHHRAPNDQELTEILEELQ
jgi:transketolase